MLKEYGHAASVYEDLYHRRRNEEFAFRAGVCYFECKDLERALEAFRLCHDRQARIYHGRCLHNLGRHQDALDVFSRAGYEGQEVELCRAELALAASRFEEAARRFLRARAYERILQFGEKYKFERARRYVAEALFQLKRYEDAMVQFRLLLRDRNQDPAEARHCHLRLGECCLEQKQDREAYHNFKRARAYSKAIEVGRRVGIAEGEIRELEAEHARAMHDFDQAIQIWHDLGNRRKVSEVTGHKLKYKGQYREAVGHFAEAGAWRQVLDCAARGELSEQDVPLAVRASVMREVGRMVSRLEPRLRKVLQSWAEGLMPRSDWSPYMSPEEFGQALEVLCSAAEAQAAQALSYAPQAGDSQGTPATSSDRGRAEKQPASEALRFCDRTLEYYGNFPGAPWAREGRLRIEKVRSRLAERLRRREKAGERKEEAPGNKRDLDEEVSGKTR